VNRSLSIEVPAADTYLRLVRMLVTAFAAEAVGLDPEEAARVRLAASEVCVAAIAAAPPEHPGVLHVAARAEPRWVDLEVRVAAPARVDERGLTVVRALADDVVASTDGDDQVVRLRLVLDVGGRAGVSG
jgi:hypothetical protein